MDLLIGAFESMRGFVPVLAVLASAALVLTVADRVLMARLGRGNPLGVARPLVMLGLTALAIVAVVLALPLEVITRGQLLSLLGLVLTAILTLSSTTFVANAMAGLMLRAVRSFRSGDFVRVADQFGRVTEMGLFHTEIQTEDHDLSTLPNLYLVTQPVTVVRASGTIVAATVSLGYRLDHNEIEALLLRAAKQSGLDDPFVHVLELGDFSVSYRVAGFLADVKQLLTTRSRLRRSMLETLHGAGIEIVSPHFMNQRRIDDAPVRPTARAAGPASEAEGPPPEARIFDKAEQAESIEALEREGAGLLEEIAELERGATGGDAEAQQRAALLLSGRRARAEQIKSALERARAELAAEK